MPNVTDGPIFRERTKQVLTAILKQANSETQTTHFKVEPVDDDPCTLSIQVRLRVLANAAGFNDKNERKNRDHVANALNKHLGTFLGRVKFSPFDEDKKEKRRGTWRFTLQLWESYLKEQKNLQAFEEAWDKKRGIESDKISPSDLESNIPLLPSNYVLRQKVLEKVKKHLLAESAPSPAVVGISGFGGVGKSVLASAVINESDVKEHFTDGILWERLGPDSDVQHHLTGLIKQLDPLWQPSSVVDRRKLELQLRSKLSDKKN